MAGGAVIDDVHFRRGDKVRCQFGVERCPELRDGFGRDGCVRNLGITPLVQQFRVHNIMLLVEPKRFKEMMRLGFIIRIKVFRPGLNCSDNFFGVTSTQLNSSPLPDAVYGVLEILEKIGNGFAVNGHRFLQRTILGG